MKAGLHCGPLDLELDPDMNGWLFPAVKAGLHCGRIENEPWSPGYDLLFPAVKAGLHCGVLTTRGDGEQADSSRP